MKAKLGVLIIHGVGSQDDQFAEPMKKILKAKISDNDGVCWKSVWWAPVLLKRESDLLDTLFPEEKRPHCGLRLRYWIFKLRKFVVNYVGDATAYRYVPNSDSQTNEIMKTNETYNQIHAKVHDAIANLRAELGDADKPVIVIAHSLGSVIMSDYIWDRQHWGNQRKQKQGREKKQVPDPYGENPFERMETLAGFITFGSPIPLFTLACDPVESITFPPGQLPANLRKKAKWLNFYNPDDVFGWPLKNLSDIYKDCPIEDKPINVGSIMTFWNPLCHSKYWTDNNFTEPVAQYISEFLKVCP